jgi:glycerol transport system substrate-binding protein
MAMWCPLSDFMAGEGKDVTLPTLDVDDFMGKSFTTGPDGKLYQLPDQQFANLYWFRYDWFKRPDFKKKFKEIYGYELGVPVNWSAYEDIAEFFTEHVREIDGKAVFGHNDYGKKAPDLGWRFTDAWLSMAGAGDKGIPNGKPVDEWGIRVEGCRPVGATVARGGAANGPAAKYALRKVYGLAEKIRSSGQLWAWIFTPTCRFWPTAVSPSRSSGTPPSSPAWSNRDPRSMKTAPPNGAWPPRPTAPTGKRA